MMPANVLFPSIQMMECLGVHDEFQMDIRKEAMHDLFWKRDEAIYFYEDLMEGMLVLVYNSSLDKTFQRNFKHRWDGPYVIHKRFTNGTYELRVWMGH